MEVLIRRAEIPDAPRIAELTVQAYVHGGHLEPDSSYVHTLEDVVPRINNSYVAVDADGVIVGAVSVFPAGSPHTEIAQPGEAEFRFLAIDPHHWGKNIGSRLIAVAEHDAQLNGVDAMVLRVISINTRGQLLYEYLGYERVPERDFTLPPQVTACGVTNVTLLALRKTFTATQDGA